MENKGIVPIVLFGILLLVTVIIGGLFIIAIIRMIGPILQATLLVLAVCLLIYLVAKILPIGGRTTVWGHSARYSMSPIVVLPIIGLLFVACIGFIFLMRTINTVSVYEPTLCWAEDNCQGIIADDNRFMTIPIGCLETENEKYCFKAYMKFVDVKKTGLGKLNFCVFESSPGTLLTIIAPDGSVANVSLDGSPMKLVSVDINVCSGIYTFDCQGIGSIGGRKFKYWYGDEYGPKLVI